MSLNEGSSFACEADSQERRMCASNFIEISVTKVYVKRLLSNVYQGLKKIIKKFKETSSFEVKSSMKSIASVPEDEATALQERTSSARGPRSLNKPVRSKHKILRNINKPERSKHKILRNINKPVRSEHKSLRNILH